MTHLLYTYILMSYELLESQINKVKTFWLIIIIIKTSRTMNRNVDKRKKMTHLLYTYNRNYHELIETFINKTKNFDPPIGHLQSQIPWIDRNIDGQSKNFVAHLLYTYNLKYHELIETLINKKSFWSTYCKPTMNLYN